ncbi:hypothetical protein SADUNF_Sadunf03G0124100 [Salix dunnii]|uniref:Uncharacterized protein n=1 Tax=Salix dunnii TaxID=1413687 RepID=A0A835N4H8_9ROSI|nr:hypothetical protein SADUNF_Sadunf03G0124100 [Salix dunnii]
MESLDLLLLMRDSLWDKSGNSREVLSRLIVDLKKHCRGDQSALRFDRLRTESRRRRARKAAELSIKHFIDPLVKHNKTAPGTLIQKINSFWKILYNYVCAILATSPPNVVGLILAGSAEFKTGLSQSDLFDLRLLAEEILSDVKVRTADALDWEIFQDSGKFVYGVEDTMKGLGMGVIVKMDEITGAGSRSEQLPGFNHVIDFEVQKNLFWNGLRMSTSHSVAHLRLSQIIQKKT